MAALAQRTLPVAIVFQAFGVWDAVAWGFVFLNTLIGLRFIIVHQLLDRAATTSARVFASVATQSDPRSLVSVIRGLFTLEIICACGVVAAMSLTAPLLAGGALGYACALAVLARRGETISPLAYFVFYGFYCVIWPIALALSLALRNPLFLSVLLCRYRARSTTRHAADPRAASEINHGFAPGGSRRRVTGAPRAIGPDRTTQHHQSRDLAIAYYARLRGTAAVVRVSWPGLERTTWLVTRHREALMAFKDPRFVRSVPNLRSRNGTRPGPMRGLGPDLLELDPPDHTRLRKLVSLALHPANGAAFLNNASRNSRR